MINQQNLDPSLASDTSASAISQSVKPSAAVPSDVIEYFKVAMLFHPESAFHAC